MQSDFDWLLAKVHLLYKREKATVRQDVTLGLVGYWCKCSKKKCIVKGDLNHHRQDEGCPKYPWKKGGKLKMYPVLGKPLSPQTIVQEVWKRLGIEALKSIREPDGDKTDSEEDEEDHHVQNKEEETGH